VAVCVAIACLIYIPRLGMPALWEPDEGRYAEIAREMVVSGDYVTPRDDWVRYFEKPPLVYWTAAAAIDLFGRNETAVRLPIAIASIIQIALTQVLAEVMFGPAAGAGAALCLALSPLFFGFGRFLTLDPVLAMFVTAAMACIYLALRNQPLSAGRNWFYLAAVCAALGTLTKGPVALVLSGGVAAVYLLIERRGRELAQVPWIGGGLIYAAITVPWFALVSLRNPGFLSFFLIHEHLQRYAVSTEHLWGPYFFLVVVVAGMWPWICFAPSAIRAMVWPGTVVDRERAAPSLVAAENAAAQAPADSTSALRFAAVWFAVVLVFFSVPRSKLGSYILPGIPAVAILSGYGLSLLPRIDPRRVARMLRNLAAFNLVIAIAALVVASHIRELRALPALRLDLLIGVGAMAAGTVAANLIWSRTHRAIPVVGAIALGMMVVLGTMVKARGDAAAMDSYRELAHAMTRELRPGCVMASYRHHVQALPFYTGWREALVGYRGELAPWGWSGDAAATFISTDDVLRALWSSGQCVILVINQRDLAVLGPTLRPPPRQIGSEGKKRAISNQPFSKIVNK